MGRKATEAAEKRNAKTRAAVTAEFQKCHPADKAMPPSKRCVFTTRACRLAWRCMYSIEEAKKSGGAYDWRHWDVCVHALARHGDAGEACLCCEARKDGGCGKAWRCVFLETTGEGEDR